MDDHVYWTIAPPVMKRKGTKVLFTVSPPPDKKYEYYNCLSALCVRFMNEKKYHYFTTTEFANERIHWHGIADLGRRGHITDFRRDFKNALDGWCFTDIQFPQNSSNWLRYMCKDVRSNRLGSFEPIGHFNMPSYQNCLYVFKCISDPLPVLDVPMHLCDDPNCLACMELNGQGRDIDIAPT